MRTIKIFILQATATYTEKSYAISKLILCMLTFAACAVMINSNPYVARFIFGIPVVLAGLLSIQGAYYSIKGINEPMSEQKIIALTVNFSMILLIVAVAMSNFIYE